MNEKSKTSEKKQEANGKRGFVGSVVRVSAPKTLAVDVVTYKMHPKYRKKYKSTKRYLVHDESGAIVQGDAVKFVSSRPHSKRKRFEVIEKVENV